MLGGTLNYACAVVFSRLGVDPVITAAGQVTASTLMLGPLALMIDHPFALPMKSGGTWTTIAGLALLSTAAA